MQDSAEFQMPKYKAFIFWHSNSMTTINNAVVGHLKPARREFRQKASAVLPTGRRQGAIAGAEALQQLKRECHFLRVVPCSDFLPEL